MGAAASAEVEVCLKKQELGECLVTPGCAVEDDVTSKYSLVKALSGGKSGAYLFLVRKIKAADATLRVLKTYPSAFYDPGTRDVRRDDAGRIAEERPFREIIALCAMSGTPGFPCLYKRGCAAFPRAWAPDGPAAAVVCPYVVMSLAPGATLSALDLRGLTPALSMGIALQLLRLLLTAERKLGAGFQHFDLHPDNIFVDLTACAPTSIVEGLRISCPSVTLIDFDLVAAPAFGGPAFLAELPEQAAKRTGAQPVPERTIAFVTKWLNPSRASAVLGSVRSVSNTDMRNWLVITHVLLTRLLPSGTPGPALHGCASARECLARYNDVFEPLFRLTRRRGGDDGGGGAAAEDLAEPVDLVLFQAMLMRTVLSAVHASEWGVRDWTALWEAFDGEVMRSVGVHPTYDTTQLRAHCRTVRPHSLEMKTDRAVGAVVTVTFGGVELLVSAPALAPRLEVRFNPPLRAYVELSIRDIASHLLSAAFGLGGRLPFSRALYELSGIKASFAAVPPPPAYNVEVESILVAPGQSSSSVVTVDVVLSLSSVLYALARLAKKLVLPLRMQELDKSAPGYQRLRIRAQLPLSDEPNACSEALTLAVKGKPDAAQTAACRLFVRQLQIQLFAIPFDMQIVRTFAALTLEGGVSLVYQDFGRNVTHDLVSSSSSSVPQSMDTRVFRALGEQSARAMLQNALPEYLRNNEDVDVFSALQHVYELTRSRQGKRKER